jgi:hypothetical protein
MGQGFALCSASRLTLGSTQPRIQGVPEVFIPTIKLTSNLHPLWRLRLHGTVHPLPFTLLWCGTLIECRIGLSLLLNFEAFFVPGIILVLRHTKWPVGFRMLSAVYRWLSCAITSDRGAGFA